jgi:sugar/nucleoside kinase (ribokinase family)
MSNNASFAVTTPSPVVIGTGLIALDVMITSGSKPAGRWTGGTCGNIMSILSYLGWGAYPVARLNGDDASKQVLRDLKKWAVRLQFAETEPSAETPIVIHKIRKNAAGQAVHRFSLNCPYCGAFLPTYRAVLASAAEEVTSRIKNPMVFFFDRVSRGALILAKACADQGALIVFEPSGAGDPGLFLEALALTHILKYSNERVHNFKELLPQARPLLEIETMGKEGLRYRSGTGGIKTWSKLEALTIASVKDTAGAGDWCTAGIIHCLGQHGLADFESAGADALHHALRFGQAMAAWTCGFEGARGGMYELSKRAFHAEVSAILDRSTTLSKALDSTAPPRERDKQAHRRSSIGRTPAQSRARSSRAACCF